MEAGHACLQHPALHRDPPYASRRVLRRSSSTHRSAASKLKRWLLPMPSASMPTTMLTSADHAHENSRHTRSASHLIAAGSRGARRCLAWGARGVMKAPPSLLASPFSAVFSAASCNAGAWPGGGLLRSGRAGGLRGFDCLQQRHLAPDGHVRQATGRRGGCLRRSDQSPLTLRPDPRSLFAQNAERRKRLPGRTEAPRQQAVVVGIPQFGEQRSQANGSRIQ